MRAYERFLNYVGYDTTSDEAASESTCPSTDKQKVLGRALVEEMKALGMEDVRMDEFGYVYGVVPATTNKELPIVGLIAHMDTSPSMSGTNVKPRIVSGYDGGDIVLNAEQNVVMRPSQFPHLKEYTGNDLIVTDGTTLLGADDKAGIAEILTAVEELKKRNIPHAKIPVAFTPDEEIGRGADHFDVKKFGAEFAYTVDGGRIG